MPGIYRPLACAKCRFELRAASIKEAAAVANNQCVVRVCARARARVASASPHSTKYRNSGIGGEKAYRESLTIISLDRVPAIHASI